MPGHLEHHFPFGLSHLEHPETPHLEHPEQNQLEHPICRLMDVQSVRLLAANPGSPHITSQTRDRSSLFFCHNSF